MTRPTAARESASDPRPEAAQVARSEAKPSEAQTSRAVNLADQLARFSEHWSPRVVGELNGQHVRLVKLQGEFVWHHHEVEDELFLVLRGQLAMHFRDRVALVNEGEFLIVPHGVEHKPAAEHETHVLLFEPAATLNTGNVRNERTIETPEHLA
jgi:mannose-6-phosphate isomerase-like protein (cupin superfamily)